MPSLSEEAPNGHHHGNTTLPVPHPTLSYWQSQPHPLNSHRSTPELPASSDVVIIGGGMAGASVAHHLLSNSSSSSTPPSILLLEARQTCSGATGRNGGHIKVKTVTLSSWIEQHGVAAVEELVDFVRGHIYAVKETVEKEGLDCEFELRRSYDVFLEDEGAKKAEELWKECLERGGRWTREVGFVGKEFAEKVTSVRDARAAFSSPACSLWPYKFVTQLLERTLAKHPHLLNLQTETPVLSLSDDGNGRTLVRTDRGTVAARKVVFATNAYTPGLLPLYRGTITPVRGTAAHLAVPDGQPKVHPHLAHTYNLEFDLAKGRVDYLNPRPDGGIVVGGGSWLFKDRRELWYDNVDDATLLGPVMEDGEGEKKGGYFAGYMQRNFCGWEGSGAVDERVWTGIMGNTSDKMPHVGKVPGTRNQWILAGFNGGGMPLIFLCAKGVARMVLDDVPFEESSAGIPAFFKTTHERLQKEV